MVIPLPSDPQRRRSAPLPSAVGPHIAPAGHAYPSSLPTVEEVSAGGVVVDTTDPNLPVAIIARINRGGRLEWRAEVPQIQEWFEKIGTDKVPAMLMTELDGLRARLGDG